MCAIAFLRPQLQAAVSLGRVIAHGIARVLTREAERQYDEYVNSEEYITQRQIEQRREELKKEMQKSLIKRCREEGRGQRLEYDSWVEKFSETVQANEIPPALEFKCPHCGDVTTQAPLISKVETRWEPGEDITYDEEEEVDFEDISVYYEYLDRGFFYSGFMICCACGKENKVDGRQDCPKCDGDSIIVRPRDWKVGGGRYCVCCDFDQTRAQPSFGEAVSGWLSG